ncbi:uncharacterized protein LOC115053637 [Echeneis naucrates]|uniref:uncharacterized protein LOC115053637 n=1 Tax=Echeneis naucrates TaxID=173247 RepID=UPI001114440D|nr:uncharacterized protein LOC115053637 [Echeneis naucrates]XP_029374369.1 uncharacterized protein LOC115053637 [Echeneis naucrates]
MRLTSSIMLQQNNNNNYPCLNVSGSTQEMLQKCSKTSLPFPSRLELGLGDLPLIRGLRAWVLCSKNRCKAVGQLGGGQSPTAPPAGHGSMTACPGSADVYLSKEWGHMGYGIPLGLDARQVGIGALVTVATLKTSEGSGKTQTQCLFLQTEKGSCLYSTAKPGSGTTTSAASSIIGGWLRGKTGGGDRDTPAGSRDNGPTLPAQTGANRVRVRSGRRWRKSSNAVGHEKTGMSRERQQRRREDPAVEKQEKRDKGGLGGLENKQSPSPQQDGRRTRCSHNVSPKACAQCRRRAQRRESLDEGKGGESPRSDALNRLNGEVKGMMKERQKNEVAEKGGFCDLEYSNSVLAVPNLDLESNSFHPQSLTACDGEEIRDAESNEELKTQAVQSKDDCFGKQQDSNSEIMKILPGNKDFIHVDSGPSTDDFKSRRDRSPCDSDPLGNPCEKLGANVNGFSDCSEKDRTDKEEERTNNEIHVGFSVVSICHEDISIPTCSSFISTRESSTPSEGNICVEGEQETRLMGHLEECHPVETDHGIMSTEELDVSRFEPRTPDTVRPPENCSQLDEKQHPSSCVIYRYQSIFEECARIVTDNSCECGTVESERREEPEENIEREAEAIQSRECDCHTLDNGSGEGDDVKEQQTKEEINGGTKRERNYKDVNNRGSQERADECRGRREKSGDISEASVTQVEENAETSTNVSSPPHVDPSTSLALSLTNPDPFLHLPGAMATSLPCLDEEEEEEDRRALQATPGDGGQNRKERPGRKLEEQDKEERGSTAEGSEEEEEDEFGVFMHAEGEPAWSGGFAMSASVPCGSSESIALEKQAVTRDSTQWTQGWTDSSFHQSDDTWTAFPQDSSDRGQDVAGQWWPASAVEDGRESQLSAHRNLVAIFAEAFPSLPGSFSGDSRGLEAVPTLAQLLRGSTSQDQGLLDSFHDLNKMIDQRYKRANGVSCQLLLKTLPLKQPNSERKPAAWTANQSLSPSLPSANQHAQSAAAKRRLSYDYNKNIME